jgi:Skp family chaperone for outer membrane proteins
MQMIPKKQLSKPKESVGRTSCGYTFSDDLFPRQFTIIETKLTELMRSPDVTQEEFESLCQSQMDVFIAGISSDIEGSLESVEVQYNDVRNRLNEEQAHRHQCLSISRLCNGDKGRAPLWYYWGLYIVLILAAMAIFATNFGLIIPEREWIGLLSAPIVAAFSYFVVYEFMRRPDKDRFLRFIHWMGILASIVMLIGFAVTRALAYLLLSGSASPNYYSGSFLYNQSSSTMDTIQMAAALATFLAAMVTEIAFAGRLSISIGEYYAARHSMESIEAGLECVEEKIQKLQDELRQLGQQLAFLRGFDAIADAWKRAKLQELVLRFKEIQSEVRNELQKQVAQLPISELRKLVGARRSIAA